MRIGVDLGGTKTEAILLAADGAERHRRRVPTPPSYDGTLDTIAALVAEMDDVAREHCTVGIGIPGTEGDGGLVKNANSTWLIARPLRADLEARLLRPVRLANDANCFALSEAADGAGAGADVVFGVILGTGVGGGIVVNGQCLTGPNGIAGEWGHNPLPWADADDEPAPACYCGRRGCLETYLSGPGMAADHRYHTGDDVAAPDVVTRAAAGDADAVATLDRWYRRLGQALASVCNVLDPDIIVLGGGMSNLPEAAERAREHA
ncbi:MAG TPA: ROK family protein, partial [Longimicrobiales bacterium]|nr:ROK family protein [Longimicrobiales bacterium]